MKKFAMCLTTALFLTACGKEDGDGPKAETTVTVDVEDSKDSLEKSLDKAGREIKAGAKEAQEKLEDAGEAIQEKYEDAKDKLDDDKGAEVEVKINKD
jgi:ElaB/YqjD/DUF883 family membrane-anchored ribosome-binding protein